MEHLVIISLWLNVHLWLTTTLCRGKGTLSMMQRSFDNSFLSATTCRRSNSTHKTQPSLNKFTEVFRIMHRQAFALIYHNTEKTSNHQRLRKRHQHCDIYDEGIEPLHEKEPILALPVESQSSVLVQVTHQYCNCSGP